MADDRLLQRPPLLRITRRCLEDDLGLSADLVASSVEEIDHEFVGSFVAKRSPGAVSSEPFVLPISGPIAQKLRWTERWRGATWYDRTHNIIWLIGAGWHESGSPSDVYQRIEQLDRQGQLFPTAEDYEYVFDLRSRLFVQDLLDVLTGIVDQARMVSPTEVQAIIGGTVPVGVAVEALDDVHEIVWLSISQKRHAGGFDPPPEFTSMILATVYPNVSNPYEWIEHRFLNRAARPDELVFACLVDRGAV